MITNDDVAKFFDQPVKIATNNNLRDPQRLGHAAAVEHFAADDARAVEQIPVGCGKSGLIALLPFGCAKGRVLVIAPNLTIRDQLAGAFDVTKPETCFYSKTGVLDDVTNGPWVAVLDGVANYSDLHDAHVIVTNIQQLAGGGGRWLDGLPDDFFSLIIVDEGHHNAAPSWQDVFDHFPDAKIISVTATPFRADDQPVEGDMIYAYPIAQAMREGYIKHIQASNVAPSELVFSYRGDERTHTLEEVLQLRENSWFSRGVALAEACNISIVDASIEWLKHLRQTGHRHQIIAAACSVDHARAIRHLYEERGWNAQEIHSDMASDKQKAIKRKLRNGELDVIVQIQMLGEGFDHRSLSVAAVFRPYRSLSPYIQFVGRVMRVNIEQTPGHPDNRGVVVSHVGLNIDQHWDDFKRIDEDDQRLVQSWLMSGEQTPATTTEGTRRPLRPAMIVKGELTLDQFLGDRFLDIPDESLPDRVLEALKAQGIDPAAVGLDRAMLAVLRDTRLASEPAGPVAQPVQPQARRKGLQRRLNEQERALAMRICQAIGLNPGGRKFTPRSGTGAATDLQAMIITVHRAVNRSLGVPQNARRDLTIDELETVLPELDAIGDEVQAQVTEAMT
ncbi:DEAD/DEAH box helicase [Frankia sp. CiP3]|uniref:DEAD/DEAH box helicase n=1 Tax=Frankia sp. CiP3 TaxID=2880971 RepID=UPI001EF7369E|nr:DEAD/DEAH box helicase family protein [Frankia sp. CiP3]